LLNCESVRWAARASSSGRVGVAAKRREGSALSPGFLAGRAFVLGLAEELGGLCADEVVVEVAFIFDHTFMG
jgi:hypothetical protein